MTFAAELSQIGPDRWTAPFWDAARDDRLVAPVCGACDHGRMPPTSRCPHCGSTEAPTWIDTSGRAQIHSFTVARQAFHPALADHVPYVLAIVALAERPDVRFATNIVDVDPDGIFVGQEVEVYFDRTDDEIVIPRFGPVSGSRSD